MEPDQNYEAAVRWNDEAFARAVRARSRSISRAVLYPQAVGAVGQAVGAVVWRCDGNPVDGEKLFIVCTLFGWLTMVICPTIALLIYISKFVEKDDARWLLVLSGALAAIQFISLPAIH